MSAGYPVYSICGSYLPLKPWNVKFINKTYNFNT